MKGRFSGPAMQGIVAVCLALGASSAAHAQANHERPAVRGAQSAGSASSLTGGSTQLCGFYFNVRTDHFTPPDDSTPDNKPANVIADRKNCRGPVLGVLSTEVNTHHDGFIHVDMRATCVRAVGPEPCTEGEVVEAPPGHTFLRNSAGDTQTQTIQMVWPDLGSGRWRYEVRLGGDGTAFVEYRTFTVQAFRGQP